LKIEVPGLQFWVIVAYVYVGHVLLLIPTLKARMRLRVVKSKFDNCR